MTDTTLRARVALQGLEAMGLTVEDLLAVDGRQAPPRPGVKTVAEYVPIVAAGYRPRSQRTHGSSGASSSSSAAISRSTASPSMS